MFKLETIRKLSYPRLQRIFFKEEQIKGVNETLFLKWNKPYENIQEISQINRHLLKSWNRDWNNIQIRGSLTERYSFINMDNLSEKPQGGVILIRVTSFSFLCRFLTTNPLIYFILLVIRKRLSRNVFCNRVNCIYTFFSIISLL